jgi:protease-4
MSLDADALVDRRRLKRRLLMWRALAVVAVVAAVIAAVGRFDGLIGREYVARISVDGIIVDNVDRDRLLATVADDGNAKALIVRIDSPGGTVVGGETLYHNLRQVAAKKPVVAVMGEVATSAAYMTALACDRILAREGTLTGSIGVILQTTDITRLLDSIGVKPEVVKSGPLKAQPNPLEPFTPEAREATKVVITDMYQMFVGMVAERRNLERAAALAVADGRVFTGRQAMSRGLIDGIGGETEAREWLKEAHGVDVSLPDRDMEITTPQQRLRDLLGGLLGKSLFYERLRLDGLVSLWHPDW